MPTQNLLRLYTVTDIDAETHVSDSLSASKQKVQVEEVNWDPVLETMLAQGLKPFAIMKIISKFPIITINQNNHNDQ